MTSRATTVEEYLSELPEDRVPHMREVLQAMREAMPEGYEEGMQYGMIGFFVPHAIYQPGYHCDKQPLPFAHLASQKNYMSLYLMCSYGVAATEECLRERFAAAGKKLNMGKSCIRFKKASDLEIAAIQEVIRACPVDAYISRYEAVLNRKS